MKPIWDKRLFGTCEMKIKPKQEEAYDTIYDASPATPKAAPKGEGVQTVILPCDPNELVSMLSLQLASFQAGNKAVRNEIVAVADELRNIRVLTVAKPKSLMMPLT